MLSLTLACPHEQVPLWLEHGETLREWRLRLVDAQHRLSAVSGCQCGAGEMVVRAAAAPETLTEAQRRGGHGLLLCNQSGCPGVALDQRDGATAGLTCYAHSPAARWPVQRETTAGRVVEVAG